MWRRSYFNLEFAVGPDEKEGFPSRASGFNLEAGGRKVVPVKHKFLIEDIE